ncbi:MAG TPA: aminopeptidase P family protein [Bacteroidetes bacterium]|nr:aminopeptidase P family protein [Bacteroidota bacterium]
MNRKLAAIRTRMKNNGIAAYIIPVTDPHLGEYVPDHWRIIRWLTGFTGSAANVVITDSFAGLWTDSRYFIQAENQLKGSGFELVKLKIPHTPEYIDWLAANLAKGSLVATDGRIMPAGTVRMIEKAFARKRIKLDTGYDLISGIWKDREPMPQDEAFEHSLSYAGKSRKEKITEVREEMKAIGADYHLLTSLDDIAWLLNIRGGDVKFSPLFTSFAIISHIDVKLFAGLEKIPVNLRQKLKNDGVRLMAYDRVGPELEKLEEGRSIIITPGTTSALLFKAIPARVDIIEEISIPTRMKAVKNRVETENIRQVMIKDGLALTRFFYWLENSIGKIKISEISAADKLLEYRLQQADCEGPSFATIAAYNEHGALPHYCATPETDAELKPEGIFLLDSGGQYYGGTTDVTRTVCLGSPTERQKTDFTLALKGTINLAMAKFPLGTKGYQIEILARKALWEHGLNYGHGTGHGVGYFLNVHEGPQTIGTGASGDIKTILEPGMLTADEPAIYREGEYGFRTENLLLCVEDRETGYGTFLKFETVTLCYIDTSLIAKELMTEPEIIWLNEYHDRVYNLLSQLLPEKIKQWLKVKTRTI